MYVITQFNIWSHVYEYMDLINQKYGPNVTWKHQIL